ncbi:MAG: hypothetical protein Q8O18_05960, partial [Deltaproteobacteria bacterium]|nr:hypothetical protein [Deltaproteobacteria bacterium]
LPFYLFWGRVLRNNLLPLFPVKGKVGTIPLKKFPRLNRQPFLKKIPEVISVPEPKGRVLYFTGCATCSTALKKEYPHFLKEMGEKTEEAMALSQR